MLKSYMIITVRAYVAIAASLLKNSPGGKRCSVTLKKTSEPKRKKGKPLPNIHMQ